MAVSSLRVVVLCCDGLYQRHLIRRAAEAFTLVGVVLQVSPPASRSTLSRLAKYRRPLRLLRQLVARVLQGGPTTAAAPPCSGSCSTGRAPRPSCRPMCRCW
jgi:hypothetical protein